MPPRSLTSGLGTRTREPPFDASAQRAGRLTPFPLKAYLSPPGEGERVTPTQVTCRRTNGAVGIRSYTQARNQARFEAQTLVSRGYGDASHCCQHHRNG